MNSEMTIEEEKKQVMEEMQTVTKADAEFIADIDNSYVGEETWFDAFLSFFFWCVYVPLVLLGCIYT